MKLNYVGYINGKDTNEVEIQKKKIIDYTSSLGIKIDHFYIDNDCYSPISDRQELNQMLKDAKTKKNIKEVFSVNNSILSNDIYEVNDIIQKLCRYNAIFTSLLENEHLKNNIVIELELYFKREEKERRKLRENFLKSKLI